MPIFILTLLLFTQFSHARTFPSGLKELPLIPAAIQEDLELITSKAELRPGTMSFHVAEAKVNTVKIKCHQDNFILEVKAETSEQVSTIYKGVKELGFLFPHPRRQLSPTLAQMKKKCGKTFTWRPALPVRGSHLHTLHPSEWVHGFFMDRPEIAEASIRWLARNGQNAMDIVLLRMRLKKIARQVKPLFELGRSLGIHTGVSVGLALQQQKVYRLLNLWQSTFSWNSDKILEKNLKKVIDAFPLSYITLKPGTSEFTPTDYDKALRWMNIAGRVTRENGIALFTKVHVSVNQRNEKYGNYNFLPGHAHPNVGVWPHTVMFYGLLDERTPIYSNKDFSDIRKFMLKEKSERPTWYYPETSYWIAMDVDVPLLLTDYLYTRAEDFKFLYDNNIEGQVNFTTGHALGGWLLDWNLALIADLDHQFSPLAALKLLGEPVEIWQKHIDFQHEWFKKQGLIAQLSAANLQDELSETERIHNRFTMKQLRYNDAQVKIEIQLLEEGLKKWPSYQEVKNEELKKLLQITLLRHQHALQLRYSLLEENRKKKKEFVGKAKAIRRVAESLIKELTKLPENYPELPLFEYHKNPTSYQFGYVYPAAATYFWKREEYQIEKDSFFPFTKNIIDVWNIIF